MFSGAVLNAITSPIGAGVERMTSACNPTCQADGGRDLRPGPAPRIQNARAFGHDDQRCGSCFGAPRLLNRNHKEGGRPTQKQHAGQGLNGREHAQVGRGGHVAESKRRQYLRLVVEKIEHVDWPRRSQRSKPQEALTDEYKHAEHCNFQEMESIQARGRERNPRPSARTTPNIHPPKPARRLTVPQPQSCSTPSARSYRDGDAAVAVPDRNFTALTRPRARPRWR